MYKSATLLLGGFYSQGVLRQINFMQVFKDFMVRKFAQVSDYKDLCVLLHTQQLFYHNYSCEKKGHTYSSS